MKRLRRPGTAAAALLALAALTFAGCSDEERRGVGQGGFVLGETLSIYVALPRAEPAAEAMVQGAKLALADAEGRVGPWKVNLALLDSSADEGGGTDVERAIDHARSILSDPQAVAMIGDLDSAAARRTAPMLNAAGVLQISPGAGYSGLTSRGDDALAGDPERYMPAGEEEQTYVRLVASERALVPALIDAAGAEGPVLIKRSRGRAGRGLARAIAARAHAAGLRRTRSVRRARVLIYAGEDPVAAARAFRAAQRVNRGIRLIGGDALARSQRMRRLPRAVRARMLLVSNAPPLERFFARRFQERFDRRASPYAAIGYEAVALVLDGIRRAGDGANVRSRLNATIRSAQRSRTLLGSYAIDPLTGETDRTETTIVRP